MDNEAIAQNFSLLARLMDIHGENSFKTKSYASAAFTIGKLTTELCDLSEDHIHTIPGIGDAIAKKIMTQLQTSELPLLNDYLEKTPLGVVEMLSIKGLGAKKISTIWKELGVEDMGELLYACNENRLLLYKGFGEKTQQNIKESIEFYLRNKGSYLYAEIYQYANSLEKKIQASFSNEITLLTGDIKQNAEIIKKIEYVTTVSEENIHTFLAGMQFIKIETAGDDKLYKNEDNLNIQIHHAKHNDIYAKLFLTSGSQEFISNWQDQFSF